MEKPVKTPGKRRQARELAIQFLYQADLNPVEVTESLAGFWQAQETIDEVVRKFADQLILGCLQHRDEIDQQIRQYTEHWELPRMAAVDRNILRLAIYEMMYRHDIPPVVSINEAVDIAKRFSTRESGAFVNGILDRLCGSLSRPARTAEPGAR